MLHMNRPIMTHRRLLLLKWLMIVMPPVAVSVGYSMLGHGGSLLETVVVVLLHVVPVYLFAETMFRLLRRLKAETQAQEQDILTMNAVMQERERLSRELHDGAAQLVAHLLLRMDTIKELVEADRKQEAEAELERLRGVADEIYRDIGESITGLRTNVRERGLVHALQDYVDQYEERYQIPVSLQTDDTADQLSPLAAFQLFRIIQEALTNVRKHAEARKASVALTAMKPDQLRVVIADDGQGYTPGSPSNGKARPLGLTSMRERVEALGGTIQVNSQPGSGTQVTVTIPIPPTRGENGHAALSNPAG